MVPIADPPPTPTEDAAPAAAKRSNRVRNLRADVVSRGLVPAFVWRLGSGGFPLIPPSGAGAA